VNGNLHTVTELAGTTDARTTVIDNDGPYDQITKIADPLTHAVQYGYQSDGALHTVTDAVGRVTTFDTNEAGQATKITDNKTKFSTYSYALGDLVTVTDPLGHTVRSFADAAGRLTRSLDAQGNTATLAYDGTGRVTSSIDPLGRVTGFEYDPNGNLHKVTDARQHTTVYDWDTSDRLQKITDPLNRVTGYTYDRNGNVKTATTPAGKTTEYDYDDLDRPKVVRYGVTSDTTQESTTGYTYDDGNRVRTIADSTSGTTTITPDVFDRTQTVVDPHGQVDCTYDTADRRKTMTVTGQAQTAYDYNNADQLISITRGTDTVGLGYDTLGRRQTLTLPAGITQTYGYDDASGLTSVTYTRGSTTLGAINYKLDALGRPTHTDGSYARVALPAASPAVAYDAANQRSGNTYDDDGNVTADGIHTYTWNARGQLTAATKTGQSTTYGYDGTGRRSTRTAAGTTTSYTYDGQNVVQEKSTTTTNLLTGGLDEVFTRGTRSLLTDALGSTIASADTTTVAGEYTYDPFGTTTVTGDDQTNPARFTGREDEGDGLYYYRARYYSTTQQQFLSHDPLGIASGSANPYTYVFNQPTALVDPFGTKPRPKGQNVDYGTNNNYGQRSGVRAILNPDNIGGKTKPDPAEPIPTFVSSTDQRAHLIAAMLGGSNRDPRNFIAMYAKANSPVMRKFEFEVRNAVRDGKQNVEFRATPIYRGTDPRALGITLQATGSGPDPLMLFITILNVRY
jgi:RHS repeat-associated protein